MPSVAELAKQILKEREEMKKEPEVKGKEEKGEIWNILLLLDRVIADVIFRDNNHWENYKALWNSPLWYAGVNLRRLYDGDPSGSFHHEGKYMKNYTRIFTSGKFVKNHKRGNMKSKL